MVTKLAQWYTIAKIKGPDTEKLGIRATVIETIIKKKPIEWILNCARVYLGKNVSDHEFLPEFIKLFTDADPYFPQKKNELEIRILAGGVLSHYASASKAKDKIFGLQAVKTGLFGLGVEDYINHEIIEEILKTLNEESILVREILKADQLKASIDATVTGLDAASLTTKFGAVNDALAKIVTYINSTLTKRVLLIDEESNIHWWIFRGFSNLKNKTFKDVEPKERPFIIGMELINLTKACPGPLPSQQFISKILIDIDDEGKEISIKDFVNNISKDDKEKYCVDPKIFNNLTPLCAGISLAKNSEDKAKWIQPFEDACAIKASQKFSPTDLALQFYNESLILRFVESK